MNTANKVTQGKVIIMLLFLLGISIWFSTTSSVSPGALAVIELALLGVMLEIFLTFKAR